MSGGKVPANTQQMGPHRGNGRPLATKEQAPCDADNSFTASALPEERHALSDGDNPSGGVASGWTSTTGKGSRVPDSVRVSTVEQRDTRVNSQLPGANGVRLAPNLEGFMRRAPGPLIPGVGPPTPETTDAA